VLQSFPSLRFHLTWRSACFYYSTDLWRFPFLCAEICSRGEKNDFAFFVVTIPDIGVLNNGAQPQNSTVYGPPFSVRDQTLSSTTSQQGSCGLTDWFNQKHIIPSLKTDHDHAGTVRINWLVDWFCQENIYSSLSTAHDPNGSMRIGLILGIYDDATWTAEVFETNVMERSHEWSVDKDFQRRRLWPISPLKNRVKCTKGEAP
jgi:hypothetical protein